MADERPYYTLIVQYDIGSWGQEFGDFDRDEVVLEAEEYPDKGTVIFRSESVDDFATLNAKIADLNRGDFGVILC